MRALRDVVDTANRVKALHDFRKNEPELTEDLVYTFNRIVGVLKAAERNNGKGNVGRS